MGWFGSAGARNVGVVFLGLAGTAAWAQEAEPRPPGDAVATAAAPAGEAASAPAQPPQDAPWRLPHPGFTAGTWGTRAPAAATPRLSVVEVEPERLPGMAPGRAHHALRMRAEWPRAALRSMGIATAECTTQFRMPSSLGRGGSFSIEVQAQLRLSCRY